ncbi:hypothetical protein LSTR_LSTR000104 [Laodelphax striatellus]|uniref:ADAMTS cysteine-rich domain-containing protein n=1 Tax=Laodelphax striatellus TaxID=195883 RepID=A0A482X7J8_LAOST|nr:hypothetical protein LSTR_LSTR000104 [Laodelphax striatellus]
MQMSGMRLSVRHLVTGDADWRFTAVAAAAAAAAFLRYANRPRLTTVVDGETVAEASNETSSEFESDVESDLKELENERQLWEREDEQQEVESGIWSGWSEWSPCSRTCDGGAAFQLRRCNAISGCKGQAIRYRICNMQPCPDVVDFREHQCSSYNEIPYNDQMLFWKPHYNDENPCALTCISNTGVVAKLADSVRDGTRWRPGSLDMCIEAKCQANTPAVTVRIPSQPRLNASPTVVTLYGISSLQDNDPLINIA